MKTAISIYEQRVAPVFDTAEKICFWNGPAISGAVQETRLPGGRSLSEKVQWLVDHGVDTLVCGAVSMPLQQALSAAGITVVPFVCGGLREVLDALAAGTIGGHAFNMPGCCGRRRRCSGGGEGRGGRCHGQRADSTKESNAFNHVEQKQKGGSYAKRR